MITLMFDNKILADAIISSSNPNWVEIWTFWITLFSAIIAIILWFYERGNENKSKVDIIDAGKKEIKKLEENLNYYIYNTISSINEEKTLTKKNTEKINCLINVLKEHSKECGLLPILNIIYDLKHLIRIKDVNEESLKKIVECIQQLREENK